MTTTKQITANKKNSQLSTGPKTSEGKNLVSNNAYKHGIFLKAVIDTNDEESEQEYKQLLDGLIKDLHPNGQMEYFLVEKISVDIWRLKRVLKYDIGTIKELSDKLINEYYSKEDWQGDKLNKSNEELDRKIADVKYKIMLEKRYMEYLEKKIVKFVKQFGMEKT